MKTAQTKFKINESFHSALNEFTRAVKFGFKNVIRNPYLSLATGIVLAIILFIFNVLFSISQAGESFIQETTKNFDLVIYLNDDLDTFGGLDLASELEKLPEVQKVTYRSKEQALETVRQENPQLIELFEKNQVNNLFPADLKIVTGKISDQEKILSYLQNRHSDKLNPLFNKLANQNDDNLRQSIAENQQINQTLNQNINQFIKVIENTLIWIISIFSIGGILVMMNAVQLTIYNRQAEIEIMKLVGAKYSGIYLPYLIESLIYALIAVVFSSGLTLVLINQSAIPALQNLSQTQLIFLFITELLAGALIGTVSSLLIVKKYLAKF